MQRILIVFLSALLFGCTSQVDAQNDAQQLPTIEPAINETRNVTNETMDNVTENTTTLTEATCAQVGGRWAECGSACRAAPPGTPCILICVTYCECGVWNGFACPNGFSCQEKVTTNDGEVGVCKGGEIKDIEGGRIEIDGNDTINQANSTNTTVINTESKERVAILFDKRAYGVYLEDITLDSASPKGACALVGIISIRAEQYITRAKICPGKDYLWVSPENKQFRIRVVDIAPGYSGQARWANILIFE